LNDRVGRLNIAADVLVASGLAIALTTAAFQLFS